MSNALRVGLNTQINNERQSHPLTLKAGCLSVAKKPSPAVSDWYHSITQPKLSTSPKFQLDQRCMKKRCKPAKLEVIRFAKREPEIRPRGCSLLLQYFNMLVLTVNVYTSKATCRFAWGPSTPKRSTRRHQRQNRSCGLLKVCLINVLNGLLHPH